MKRSFLSLFLALNLSMALSGSAHAIDFGKIIEKAKNGVVAVGTEVAARAEAAAQAKAEAEAAASKPIEEIIPKINDSKYFFALETGSDSKWVMLNVTKGEYKQQILIPVKNHRASELIYLKSGAGIYNIAVAESKLEGKYDGGYYVGHPLKIENIDTRDLNFLFPSDLVQSDNDQIIALAKKITVNAIDELDAIKKIHKYVASNVKYDYASYKDGSFKIKPFDALTTLNTLTGVCAGYANLYAALLRSIGVKTKIIYGIAYLSKTETGEHAWNEVLINNEWKSVDVTWDSTTGKMYKYFDIAEEVFDQDHQKQTEQNF